MVDKMQVARARVVLPKAVQRWIYDPNVTLIGVGMPEKDGQIDESQVAIRFHVRDKYEQGPQLEMAIAQNDTSAEIPKEIDGIPTDVVQAQYRLHQSWMNWGRPANPRAQVLKPIQCGAGISCERIYGSGTLGALVVDRQTGKLMCMSNFHVLVGGWGIRPPLSIYQPGRLDGGDETDTFAIYERDAMNDNLDAAVASIYGDRSLINKQIDLGPVLGMKQAELGMHVVKSGYMSGITEGKVTLTNATARLPYYGQTRLIRSVMVIDQIEPYSKVSDPGDSGSLWLESETNFALGLHFAGTNQPEQALAMDIQAILDSLQVDLVAG